MKEYGHFSKDGREYVITRSDTPRPWVNYLFNHSYHAIISQAAGGFSYYRDPKYFRLLRYPHLMEDRPGRYVFIRDEENGKVFSPTWQPFCKKLNRYECVHGLGYTRITGEKYGIRAELNYFVPANDPLEIWRVKIENRSNRRRHLTLFPFIEWLVGDVSLEVQYRNILCLYNRTFHDPVSGVLYATKLPYPKHEEQTWSFFYSSIESSGFETSREKFLGRYGSIISPAGLSKPSLQNSLVEGEDMVGVFSCPMELKAKEKKEFVVLMGRLEKPGESKKMIRKYGGPEKSARAWVPVEKYWKERTGFLTVDTPDKNFNVMVNIWGRYQLIGITHWRGTSHYHGTEGGLGYRDTAQDAEGLFAIDLELARQKMIKLLQFQYKTGHAVSGFSDIEGPWENQGDGLVTGKSDVAVWLPYMLVSYIKETGDRRFLKKKIPFHDGASAPVYEHALRAVRYIYRKRGEHGFPLIGKADWNDAYDQVGTGGRGESIWLAMALARACKQMGELAEFIGDVKVEKEMKRKFNTLKRRINESGWDGKWYSAAFNDDGMRIGSRKQKEGCIPLNSQTWAILSETVTPERLPSILKQIDEDLFTEYGPALFTPAYSRHDPGIGRVTSFARGTKENAAVFSHACAFKIVADCMLGRGNEAYDTYDRLMPTFSIKKNDPEKYAVEPYVFSEYVVGPDHPDKHGEGSFTWNTGTTPWMFVAATEWILGARREFRGLRVDPCIPSSWKECSIVRPFRGRTYHIHISNPNRSTSSVKAIHVNGKKIRGSILPLGKKGQSFKVEVLL